MILQQTQTYTFLKQWCSSSFFLKINIGFCYEKWLLTIWGQSVCSSTLQLFDLPNWWCIFLGRFSAAILCHKFLNGLILLQGSSRWLTPSAGKRAAVVEKPAASLPWTTISYWLLLIGIHWNFDWILKSLKTSLREYYNGK